MFKHIAVVSKISIDYCRYSMFTRHERIKNNCYQIRFHFIYYVYFFLIMAAILIMAHLYPFASDSLIVRVLVTCILLQYWCIVLLLYCVIAQYSVTDAFIV